MSTQQLPIDADLQAVCKAIAGNERPDENLVRRVRQRADELRREIQAKQGILNIAVALVREVRDEA